MWVEYLQALPFCDGEYSLTLPTCVPASMLAVPVSEAISVAVTINAGAAGLRWACKTHALVVDTRAPAATAAGPAAGARGAVAGGSGAAAAPATVDPSSRVALMLAPEEAAAAPAATGSAPARPPRGADVALRLTYRIAARAPVATLLHEPASPGATEGTFLLYIAPPAAAEVACRRRVVFLLDASGSMAGPPLEAAKAALSEGLTTMTERDEFGICVFNVERLWWNGTFPGRRRAATLGASPKLLSRGLGSDIEGDAADTLLPTDAVMMPGTRENVLAAQAFVKAVAAEGRTDILSAVQQAYAMLMVAGEEEGQNAARLPLVVLFTDGAVAGEPEICMFVKERNEELARAGKAPVRIFTFGIGAGWATSRARGTLWFAWTLVYALA